MAAIFSVIRYSVKVEPADQEFFAPLDLAVPVIDGVPLYQRLEDRYPGVKQELVAPPSRHWLGEPKYEEDGRAVILDGSCGVAGCCGVMAHITLARRFVVWSDFFARGHPPLPDGLHFEFDRTDYEAAIAELPAIEAVDWVFL